MPVFDVGMGHVCDDKLRVIDDAVNRPLALPSPASWLRGAPAAMALSKLSGDVQGLIFVQLCNVLDPCIAVALQLAYLPRGLGLCKAAEGAARQRHAAQCVRREGLVRG